MTIWYIGRLDGDKTATDYDTAGVGYDYTAMRDKRYGYPKLLPTAT